MLVSPEDAAAPARSPSPPILWRYGAAVIAVSLAAAARYVLDPLLGDYIPFLFFHLAVIAVALHGHRGPALLALISGGLVAWYLFTPPRLSFALPSPVYSWEMAAYFLVGFALVLVTNRRREEQDRAATSAFRAEENARLAAEREVSLTQEARERQRVEDQRDLALQSARLGFWEWDIATNDVRWSENMEAIYGLSPGSFDGTYEGYERLLHPDDRSLLTNALQQSLRTGEDHHVEFRILLPGGKVRWLSSTGRVIKGEGNRPVAMVGIGMDIDARKRAEEELQKAYDREKRIAETLQRSLLIVSEEDRTLQGMEVEPLYEAASDEAMVGGDFYDVVPVAGGSHVALVVGDVSGKGLVAAAQTAEVKYVLRAYLNEDADVERTLSRLNVYLSENRNAVATSIGVGVEPIRGFVALCLVIINLETGAVRAAVAGAEPPLLLPGDLLHPASILPVPGSLPLGIDAASPFASLTFNLDIGDTLLLCTDGVMEARQGRRFLGPEGLIALVEPLRNSTPPPTLVTLGDVVMDGARRFCGGTLRDDACVLLARRQPKLPG